jgi:hypothetical protein
MSDDRLTRRALEILARVPDAPPGPGDELPLTEKELRALRAVGVDPDPGRVTGEPVAPPGLFDPDLPGLDLVRAAARTDLPEAVLAGFLSTPQPDLEAGGAFLRLRTGSGPGGTRRRWGGWRGTSRPGSESRLKIRRVHDPNLPRDAGQVPFFVPAQMRRPPVDARFSHLEMAAHPVESGRRMPLTAA